MPSSRRATSRTHSWLLLKVPPLLLVLVFGVGMWFAPAVLSVTVPKALAVISATAGLVFCIAGLLEFWRADTTVDPRDPSETSALVVRGVYRITRNPMYLGFAWLLLALALLLEKPLAVALVPLFMAYLHRFQIRPEEDALRERFGASYEAYCQQVRRWL